MTPTTQNEITLKLWTVILGGTIPLVTFLLGFLVSRFTMSKKESKDIKLKLQENANAMNNSLTECFTNYTLAISSYIKDSNTDAFPTFFNISTSGEAYFSQLRMICDSILSGSISKVSAEMTFSKIISDAVTITLPAHYDTLKEIADKHNFPYTGKLDWGNYKSIIKVYQNK